MHRPGIVGKEEPAFPQLFDQLVETRFPDEIGAVWAELLGNCYTHLLIFFGAEKNPLTSDRVAAAAAKRSASHRFAGPYSAPGQIPILDAGLPHRRRGGEHDLADFGDRP